MWQIIFNLRPVLAVNKSGCIGSTLYTQINSRWTPDEGGQNLIKNMLFKISTPETLYCVGNTVSRRSRGEKELRIWLLSTCSTTTTTTRASSTTSQQRYLNYNPCCILQSIFLELSMYMKRSLYSVHGSTSYIITGPDKSSE